MAELLDGVEKLRLGSRAVNWKIFGTNAEEEICRRHAGEKSCGAGPSDRLSGAKSSADGPSDWLPGATRRARGQKTCKRLTAK